MTSIPTKSASSSFPPTLKTFDAVVRNTLTHEYDRVEVGIIWDTIRNDLPPLVPMLEKVLAEAAE